MTESEAPSVHLKISGLSDVGRVRTNNQDSLLAADLTLHRELGGFTEPIHDFGVGGTIDVVVGQKGFVFLVADGMGGAQAGEVASHLAATGVYEELMTNWAAEAALAPDRFAGRLAEAVVEANRRIFEAANQHVEYHGMGTTLTLAGVLGDMLYLAQVGDSRGYLVRRDDAVQLSRDQSVVEHLVRAGQMSQDEAARSQRKNVLLQAMGTVANVEVDVSFQSLRQGDAIVLCSDGLTGVVGDSELAEAVRSSTDPSIACSELVALANARGGTDNITVIVAEVSGPGLALPTDGDSVGYAAFPLMPLDDD